MIVIAGATQIFIYYLEYWTLVLDDGSRASDLIPFTVYIDAMLTKAHYRFGRTQVDMGEAGIFGYFMAAVQFVGFILGGLFVFIYLFLKPACPSCNMYLRKIASRLNMFHSTDAAVTYYELLFEHPTDSAEFDAMCRMELPKGTTGKAKVRRSLLVCPKCKKQSVEDKVEVWNGREWKEVTKMGRCVPVSEGIDLTEMFRA